MIEVKLELHTPWELAVIHEGMTIIHKAREAQYAIPVEVGAPAPETTQARDARIEKEAADEVNEIAPEAPAVIATITPEGVTKASDGPSKEDMEKALVAFLAANSPPAKAVPLARALLSEYGAVRVVDVPVEKWPELLAKLEAR